MLRYDGLVMSLINGYSNSQLVPYQRVKQAARFEEEIVNHLTYNGGSFNLTVFNGQGYSWAITVKYIRYYPLANVWDEDTSANWLSITPTTGSGTGVNITCNYGYNDTIYERRMEITITSNGTSFTTYAYQDENPGVDTTPMDVSIGSNAENACVAFINEAGRLHYYIKDGYTWTGADKLYVNVEGTTLADTGWYSNGAWARYWNKSNQTFNGLTQCEEDNSEGGGGTPTPDNKTILLVQDNPATSACQTWNNTGARQTFYIPDDKNWTSTGVLYANEDGSTLANTGWYSNGTSARLWIKESSSFIDSASCA
ncbi:BACON domain-containing protein [Galbibacter pacificus]|uniref:Uncharacterized protein n=1 Tax=Galbibacter pacificus TaxID=2996052 RepID=A0ABT6FR99_9FLAO|nr:BACON domain-containing carbohydrate-binding protein [Galbibacter pacificus]MDG3581766.1 hypothetical protein [Galbibacter pacificus]MDG3585760.1 hypothetical protein [Galbibacter pacificus]